MKRHFKHNSVTSQFGGNKEASHSHKNLQIITSHKGNSQQSTASTFPYSPNQTEIDLTLSKCYSSISMLKNKIDIIQKGQRKLYPSPFGFRSPKTIQDLKPSTPKGIVSDLECLTISKNLKLISEENENVRISNNILTKTNVELQQALKSLNKIKMEKNIDSETVKEIISDNKYLKNQIEEMTKEKNSIMKMYAKLESKFEEVWSENERLRKENTDYLIANHTMKNSNKHLRKSSENKSMELNHELSKKDETIAKLQKEINILKIQNARIEASNQETNYEVEKLKRQLNDKDLLLSQVKPTLNLENSYTFRNSDKDISNAKTTLENYEETLSRLQEENKKIKLENILLKKECEAANEKFNKIIKETSGDLALNSGRNSVQENLNSNRYFSTTIPHSSSKTSPKRDKSTTKNPSEGIKYLFSIYDSKNVLRFDLFNKEFQIQEFNSETNNSFSNNFIKEGSCYLNVPNGLIILTGLNYDILFHYHYETGNVRLVKKLSSSHSYASMVLDKDNANVIILSGRNNKSVEVFHCADLIMPNATGNSYGVYTIPEMQSDRSESSVVILNKKIFSFFGYSSSAQSYLNNIEWFDLNKDTLGWSYIDFKSSFDLTVKGSSIAIVNDNDLFFLGGSNEKAPKKKIIVFNMQRGEFEEITKELPEIYQSKWYNFSKETMFMTFEDENKNINLANIDDNNNVHVIQVPSLAYDLYKFEA